MHSASGRAVVAKPGPDAVAAACASQKASKVVRVLKVVIIDLDFTK